MVSLLGRVPAVNELRRGGLAVIFSTVALALVWLLDTPIHLDRLALALFWASALWALGVVAMRSWHGRRAASPRMARDAPPSNPPSRSTSTGAGFAKAGIGLAILPLLLGLASLVVSTGESMAELFLLVVGGPMAAVAGLCIVVGHYLATQAKSADGLHASMRGHIAMAAVVAAMTFGFMGWLGIQYVAVSVALAVLARWQRRQLLAA